MLRAIALAGVASAALSVVAGTPVNLEAATTEPAAKITVELYFEGLCPFCHQFITESLTPAADLDGIEDMVTLKLIPYGNAKETPEMHIGGGYTYQCQHGPEECALNKVIGCAQSLAADDWAALPFVDCMAHAGATVEKDTFQCSLKAGLDHKQIMQCYNNHQGDKIVHENAVSTGKLNPPHSYVPWIVVDGKHTEKIQSAIQTNFLGYVCSLYKGRKPAACPKPSVNYWPFEF